MRMSIDLMIADVVMPDFGRRDLRRAIEAEAV
jgi:hypothetical protein